MKEKITKFKDKVVDIAKKVFHYLKTNLFVTSIIAFVIIVLALLLIATLALHEFIVSVCVLIIIETMMSVLLHKVELWKHAILVVAQIIAGVIIGRIPLIIICVLVYIAATVAQHFMFKKSKTSPKA